MKRAIAELSLVIAITFLFATTAVSRTPSACSQWDLSGEWTFVQSNGTSPVFKLQHTPTGLQGSAIYYYEYDDSGYYFPRTASVDGTLKGSSFEVTAYWDNGTIGVYAGKIGPQGRIEGTTHDKQRPETKADFYSDHLANCASQAACSQWDMTGQWSFVQTNATTAEFTLQQTQTGLQGTAIHRYVHKDENIPGFKVGDSYHRHTATVNGAINGNALEIVAYWSNGTIGVYTGKIGPQGRIEGTTYDKQDPRTTARWYSGTTAKCLSGGTGERIGTTSSALRTGPEPVRPQGRVQSGGTYESEIPICVAARQARERNSPAAPGLEAKCAAQDPIKAQRRVRPDAAAATDSPRSICDLARQARERNSPAARGLEEKCRAAGAAGEIAPVRAQGRVKPADGTTPGTPKPICESARQARERNSPAAPGLEEQCRVITKGEQIANEDPLAVELRDQQISDRGQDGFNFGMALAEGHTAPGPGKDKACASLSSVEQGAGCRAAVLFSVERNRNATFAQTGAKIAAADEHVAEARNTETDVFYKLGFDIASGIYGDPALGAQARTAPGPVLESLSAAGKRGFYASLKLHASRNYRR